MRHCVLIALTAALCGCGLPPRYEPEPTVSYAPGSKEPIVSIAQDDPKMLAAIQKAKKGLPKFIKMLENPPDDLAGANVKMKFTIEGTGDVEGMWMGVVDYKNRMITGELLQDSIKTKHLKAGKLVQVPVKDVVDWQYIDTKGREFGGYTDKVLDEAMKNASK